MTYRYFKDERHCYFACDVAGLSRFDVCKMLICTPQVEWVTAGVAGEHLGQEIGPHQIPKGIRDRMRQKGFYKGDI